MDDFVFRQMVEQVKHPKDSWKRVTELLRQQDPFFLTVEKDQIKDRYLSIVNTKPSPTFTTWTQGQKNTSLSQILSSPNTFYYRNVSPGQLARFGPWTNDENTMLEILVNEMFQKQKYIQWGILSQFIPGRVGYQCLNQYKLLKKKHLGNWPAELDASIGHAPRPYLKRAPAHPQFAFAPDTELRMVEHLKEIINDPEATLTREQVGNFCAEFRNDPDQIPTVAAEYVCWRLGKPVNLPDGTLDPYFIQLQTKYEDLVQRGAIESVWKQAGMRTTFTASHDWVSSFMKRHGLSLRKAHYARRGEVDPILTQEFLQRIQDIKAEYGLDRVFNLDETFIRLFHEPEKQVGIRGAEKVKKKTKCKNEKEGFTCMGFCNMQTMLPPTLIAKGKTKRCEKKLQDASRTLKYDTDHSESGWSSTGVMNHQFGKVRAHVDGIHGEEAGCAVVIDQYSTHVSAASREVAEMYNIELVEVPANQTGLLQPLDRKIFGQAKSSMKRIWRDRLADPDAEIGEDERYKKAANAILRGLYATKDSTAEHAWNYDGL